MKLTVLITTYNHERYIAQALDGILMQQTDFDFDIVLVDDFSTDRTREIVRDFQHRYPERFQLVMPVQRSDDQGLRLFLDALQATSGEYIAMLDGDDFWTSAHKLQKQVTFLDTHPEYSMCFHNVRCFFEDGSRPGYNYNPSDQKRSITVVDMLRRNSVAGCSPVVRRAAIAHIPEWMYAVSWADWTIYLLCAEWGLIGYLDEILGAYRIHHSGMWSGLSRVRQFEMMQEFYTIIDRETHYAYAGTIRASRAWRYYRMALVYEADGQDELAKACIHRSYGCRRTVRELCDPHVLKTAVRLNLPSLYDRLVALKRAFL